CAFLILSSYPTSIYTLSLHDALPILGGENGIGLLDIVENRMTGMKDRGVYETPGGTILYRAHEILEQITVDKDTMHMKRKLAVEDRKSTRLNSSHVSNSYAVFCLKKK